jgi:formylglycine-generating enzyme required for sulfatase activity
MAIDATSGSASRAADSRTARQRVALFKATASEPAKALANCMAVIPVSLPAIDLLRQEFVTEAQQEHVAEVLLSGLLQRVDETESDERCQYEFFGDGGDPGTTERVRDLLLDDVPIDRTVSVLNRISQLIRDRAGNTLKSFEAFLTAFKESGTALGEGALPLATVGLDVLRRLGGPHAVLAKRYEPVLSISEKAAGDVPTEDLEIDFPPLQSCEYESATIVAILERFDFETATLQRKTRSRQSSRRWALHRLRAAAWGYTEMLSPESGEEINLDMIDIPGGSFRMGATKSEPESSDRERPQHEVTIQPFYLSRYPISQAQWRVVAGYESVGRKLNPDPSHFKGDNRPVEQVSWEDAKEFCQRLSAKTGRDYRLPSEAQWEYACRAGTTTPFHFGETITTDLANFNGDYTYNGGPKGHSRGETSELGIFLTNNWGLHDMHGNVWEWCEDDWHDNYEGAPKDGSAWVESEGKETRKLLRGGSWFFNPMDCRSAGRFNSPQGDICHDVGFRVCCVPPRVLPS